MLTFIDEKGQRYGALAEFTERKAVNGEKSLSGVVLENESVIHGLDRGWRIEFQNEFYVVTYALPVDYGDAVELEFDAVHEFFYDFSKSAVYGVLEGSNTAERYLDLVFEGSGYSYRLETSVPAFERESFGMDNRLPLFQDVIRQSGLEFSVSGRVVRILRQVGTDLSTLVKKGFNLQELRLEKNLGDFITYKRGFGKWNDPDDHTKGRLEAVYESPLTAVFGKLEGAPVVDERYSVTDSLINRLKSDVEASYTISVQVTLEDLNKAGYEYERPQEGDYIMAINDDLGFQQRIRIVSYETDYDASGNIYGHRVSCNSLGAVEKLNAQDAGIRTAVKQAREEAQKAVGVANAALISADGKGMRFFGETDPLELGHEVRYGDMWYQKVGEETVLKYWNGYEWQLILSTAEMAALRKEIEDVIAQADSDRAAALAGFQKALDDAKTYADTQIAAFDQEFQAETGAIRQEISAGYTASVQAAKSYTDTQLAAFDATFEEETGAIREELEAGYAGAVADAKSYSDTKAQEFDTQINAVKLDVTTVSQQADKAVNTINTAVEAAGFTDLSTSLTGIKGIANTAQANAQTGIANAATALSQANSALSQLTGVNGKITTVERNVNDLTGQMSLKITSVEAQNIAQTAVDNLEIGGRNYFSPSRVMNLAWGNYGIVGGAESYRGFCLPVKPGEIYSLSRKSTTNNRFSVFFTEVEPQVGVQTLPASYRKDAELVIENMVVPPKANWLFLYLSNQGDVLPDIMLEKGTKVTDFSPNPEDAINRITQVETDLSVQDGLIAAKVSQTVFDSLAGRVSTAEASLTVTQNALTAKADKSIVDTLSGNVSSLSATLQTQAGRIDLMATKQEVTTAVEGIVTSGNNLAASSKIISWGNPFVKEGNVYKLSAVASSSYYTGLRFAAEIFEIGKPYILSFKIKKTSGNIVTIAGHSATFDSKKVFIDGIYIQSNWQSPVAYPNDMNVHEVVVYLLNRNTTDQLFIQPNRIEYGKAFTADIWDIQVEQATNKSSYSIPQEDILKEITSVSAALTVEADKIIGLLTRTTNNETAINSVKSTADGTLQTVTNHTGKITTLETNVNGLQTTVANKADKTELTVLANGISSKVESATYNTKMTQLDSAIAARVTSTDFETRWTQEKNSFNLSIAAVQANLDNLEVGGRNYYQNGHVVKNSSRFLEFRVHNFLQDIKWETVIVSFDVKLNAGGISRNIDVYHYQDSGLSVSGFYTFKPTETWVRHHYVGYVDNKGIPSGYSSGSIAFYDPAGNNAYSVKNFKIALGTKDKEWSPAPEDLTTNATIMTQLNLNPEGILLQGKNIQLDGNVTMTDAFITRVKAHSIDAVYADIATIRSKILVTDVVQAIHIKADAALIDTITATTAMVDRFFGKTAVVTNLSAKTLEAITANITSVRSQVLISDSVTATHLKVDNALIDVLTANTAVLDRLFTKTAYVDRLNTKTLAAVTANITTIRSQVLVTDSVTSTHLKSDTALIEKLFATTANIQTLTGKTAFINAVKAVDISADRITSGSLNSAIVNSIYLNVNNLTGNKAEFVQLGFNGINGNIKIDSVSLTATNTLGGYSTSFTNGGIHFKSGSYNHQMVGTGEGVEFQPLAQEAYTGIRLKNLNYAYVDLGTAETDLGYRTRLDSNKNRFSIINKQRENIELQFGTVNPRTLQFMDGQSMVMRYGKTQLVINGYDDSRLPQVWVANATGGYAGLRAGQFNYVENGVSYSLEKTINEIITRLVNYASHFNGLGFIRE